MEFLENLLGGGQQRQEHEDFINRYEQGPPYDGFSHEEAMNRYQQVATQLPPDMYQQAAQQAFSRLSPEDRMQFGQQPQQQVMQQGYTIPGFGQGDTIDQYQGGMVDQYEGGVMDPYQGGMASQYQGGMTDQYQDPSYLAQMTTQMHQQDPNMLGQLLGGMGGSPAGKGVMGGIAAMALKQFMGR